MSANAIPAEYAGIRFRHRDGDHHLGEPPVAEIRRFWTIAGNTTQWKPAT